MLKRVFHNEPATENQSNNVNVKKVYSSQASVTVDINTLLNRVKIDKKNELKKKINYIVASVLILVIAALLISFIK